MITSRRKKTIASLFLALLLVFSFNASPIILLANHLRSANAYKTTETKSYYSNTSSELEKNFSDAQYPSSLKDNFDGSQKNFNVYNYYIEKFEEQFKAMTINLFNSWSGDYGLTSGSGTYQTDYEALRAYCNNANNIYEVYEYLKDSSYLKQLTNEKSYSITSYQEFVDFVAVFGLPNYDTGKSLQTFVSSFSSETNDDTTFQKLSIFYRILRNTIESSTTGYDEHVEDDLKEEGKVNYKLTTKTAFWEQNTHYLAVKKHIDDEIKKTAPINTFDNSQDTNIAAIIANNAPTSLRYNYTNNFKTYTTPKPVFLTTTYDSTTFKNVYYWGESSDLNSSSQYQAFINIPNNNPWIIRPLSEKPSDMASYRVILPGEYGYVNGVTTYNKISDSDDFLTITSSKYSVYVLNNNPTQSELDTYAALYFTVISQNDLDEDMGKSSEGSNITYNNIEDRYYVNVPYETDELYFKHVFNKLYTQFGNNEDEYFDKFVEYFTYKDETTGKPKTGTSKLYLKYKASNEKYVVFINEDDYNNFVNDYPNYSYRIEKIDKFSPDYNENDYQKIESNSTYKAYIPTKETEGQRTFDLYLEKVKEYYTSGTTTTYVSPSTSGQPQYEQEKDVITNLETEMVVDLNTYEFESGTRKVYILDNGSNFSDLTFNFTYSILSENELNENPNYYVSVPLTHYQGKTVGGVPLENSEFKLYYKHGEKEATKIYVVDKSDNAQDNKIYKNLNYNVITPEELTENYPSNYLVIGKEDSNYNENFLLYYKYRRTVDNPSTYYVLLDDVENVEESKLETLSSSYSFVGSGELYDYKLLSETGNETVYNQARSDFFNYSSGSSTEAPTIRIYQKLSNVFVQNELRNGNAIYIVDSSLSDSDRKTYSQNFWTAITKTDLSNNPDLYVQISEKDTANYSENYTLYYKYVESTPHNKVYSIDDIDTTSSTFNSNDYELITSGTDFVAGKELYYKKNIFSTTDNVIDKPTYYYYKTSSTVTLSSNSYYAISFYVYTIGDNAWASFTIKDTAGAMSDINLNNINTAGKWQQYFVFISTDSSTASKIDIYLRMGDEENGIIGGSSSHASGIDKITGSVFFDNIEITKIGVTDYNKKALNNVPVYSTLLKNDEGTDISQSYADKYNNQIFIANEEALKDESAGRRFENNKYEYKNFLNNPESSVDYKGYKWNDLFDFNNASDNLKQILGYYSADGSSEGSSSPTVTANQLKLTLGDFDSENQRYNLTGRDMYNLYEGKTVNSSNDLFPYLWRYYLSRSIGEDGLSLEKYLKAYADDNLEVSITNQIETTKTDDEDDEEEDNSEETKDDKDIVYVSNPFNDNNYALKLKNTNNDLTLGLTSNAFTIKQFGYYKITVWIYSPDKDGKASLSLTSVRFDPDENETGSLLESKIDSTYANVANSSATNAEYGWIPVTFYVEGNARRDMECYLVLSACKNSTVYFDNITIESISSTVYDSNTSSGNYSNSLSLSSTDIYDKTGVKNGNFDYIVDKNAKTSIITNSDTPRTADSWTALSSNSSRVVAGIVSMKNQPAFFKHEYVGGNTAIPIEGGDNYSNVYAIYAPKKVDSLKDSVTETGKIKVDYKHNYSISSGSLSLSSSSLYKISFKFYMGKDYDGTLVSKIHLSNPATASTLNVLSSMIVEKSDLSNITDTDGWQTFTFYIATGTSSKTVYIQLGVEDAVGLCYFKNVSATKVTSGETIDDLISKAATENGILASSTVEIYNAIKNMRFMDMSNMDFSYHDPIKDETGLFEQKVFTNKTETTDKHTSGKSGVVVASYFDTVKTTTHSVTINKVTYYIGEVYKVNINETEYFIHKTYNSKTNSFEYKLYSDSALTQEVTKINEEPVTIEETSGSVRVDVGTVQYTNVTTTYRLYKFSDLREEVTEINGSAVHVENLDKVTVGTGSKATENASTSKTNTSYIYQFNTADTNYNFNNALIPSSELKNNQSGNVLILSNAHSTDYISLEQAATRTLGKSTYNVLRIYVKTSDFASDDFGLNIKIDAINVEWTNINTTNSKLADKYGFVCYEALISTNSSDSISGFGVKLSLGSEDSLGRGYAIISNITLDTFASKDEFTHYSDLVGDDNENIKKKVYEETKSDTDTSEKEEPDDKNSVSWATFFYIFSSVLLVVTMAVAMVALVLKKHPLKFAKKFANEHERDIDSISSKKANLSSNSESPQKYGAEAKDKKSSKDKNNSGGII